MSGETGKSVSGWTVDTLAAHLDTIRRADERFEGERDRRHTEVALGHKEALKIKERADRDALGLAREIQTYKDEKANELREQINSERGLYATKGDLIAAIEKIGAEIKPLADYMAADRGRGSGFQTSWTILLGIVAIISALYVLRPAISAQPAPPQVIYLPAGAVMPVKP